MILNPFPCRTTFGLVLLMGSTSATRVKKDHLGVAGMSDQRPCEEIWKTESERESQRETLRQLKDDYYEQNQWLDALNKAGLGSLTFETEMVDVTLEEAKAILSDQPEERVLTDLAQKIAVAQEKLGATQIFVKFQRSPKDSFVAHKKGVEILHEILLGNASRDVVQLFKEARMSALGASNANEAIDLLRSSNRIRAPPGTRGELSGGDLWHAVNSECLGEEFSFTQMGTQLMVRKFDHPLPLYTEWRAFVWDGVCHAISQQWYGFAFPELQDPGVKERLLADFEVFAERTKAFWEKMPKPHHGMWDLVWEPETEEPVKIVELNSFLHYKGFGVRGSMALFDWDEDMDQIKNGTSVEVRLTPVPSQQELSQGFKQNWVWLGPVTREAIRCAMLDVPEDKLKGADVHPTITIAAQKLGLFRKWKPPDPCNWNIVATPEL